MDFERVFGLRANKHFLSAGGLELLQHRVGCQGGEHLVCNYCIHTVSAAMRWLIIFRNLCGKYSAASRSISVVGYPVPPLHLPRPALHQSGAQHAGGCKGGQAHHCAVREVLGKC